MSHGNHGGNPLTPNSRFFQGGFGRLFPDLSGWGPGDLSDPDLEAFFVRFVEQNMVEAPGVSPTEVAADDDLRNELDGQFNSQTPAGYTYFGQFIDHDLTLDTTSLSDSRIDPNRLHNFRTPRFDLDSVYGRGPGDQPYLYEHNDSGFTGRMLVGSVPNAPFPDLPRNPEGRAIIGDMRNDENAIVAQLQLAFILAHNALVTKAIEDGLASSGAEAFDLSRRALTWLYQWIVFHDFLPRVTQEGLLNAAISRDSTSDGRPIWKMGLEDIFAWRNQPFMPVEYSVAAYRFGHSMVRNSYQTNDSDAAGFQIFIPIFDSAEEDDLRGFRPLSARRVVQWDWFLQMSSSGGPFPQLARKIDTKLSNALAALPETGGINNVLAARNLVRGVRMQIPSGTDVARHLCVDQVDIEPSEPESLWYYILKEAEVQTGGEKLGHIGSLLVTAVMAGFLKGDPRSWVNVEPCWTPDDEPLLDASLKEDEGKWSLASIIRLSGLPVSGDDFQA